MFFQIVRIRRHPYAFVAYEIYYDLALLTMKNELIFGSTIQPACLPPKDAIVKSGIHTSLHNACSITALYIFVYLYLYRGPW